VNTEQAPKLIDADADLPDIQGRPPSWRVSHVRAYTERSDTSPRVRRGSGDGMCATGESAQHGIPDAVIGREATINRTPARDRPGRMGSRRGP
jgi:hypothetical protein